MKIYILNILVHYVHRFLKYSIEYLNEKLHVEGIFRQPGNSIRIKELKKQVEKGVYDFQKFQNDNYFEAESSSRLLTLDVACLLKQFFRELPEP